MGFPPAPDRLAQQRYEYEMQHHLGERQHGDGWVSFSVVLLTIASFLNLIGGIAALSDSKFYSQGVEYVVGSLHTWAWVTIGLAAIQLALAWGIYNRNQLARWGGVLMLSLDAIAQLLMIAGYPLWSLAIFALDVIAIYGLILYGQRPEPRP
jgi:hypothetical protein